MTNSTAHRPTYISWLQMKSRCSNTKHHAYVNYGGRGITVCERWKSFTNFLTDMGERPSGTTLDRFPNVDGNYEPGNVRWATNVQQRRNQRRTKLTIEHAREIRTKVADGRTHASVAREYGVGRQAVSDVVAGKTYSELTVTK